MTSFGRRSALDAGESEDHTRRLIATTLQLGHWPTSLHTLARIDPSAVATIADELLAIDDLHV